MIKFTEYVVNNSITNTLSDDKFDVDKPFNFIEYLNYVKVIDNNDLENFNQYKKYLEKWKNTDFENNRDNALNIKAIYKNFFNDLTLKYSTQEQRRFFNTIDLDNDDSLTKIIPFYRDKIVEILNYYREKRNTFQRELREKQGKGSNLSVKDQIRNNIANFFTSPDYTGEVVSLSSLRIDVELGYDTFNDYFDVNPESVNANETYITNDINANAFLDIDKALIQVLNDNNITLTELNPYKLVVEFNEVNTSLLQRDDFIDYKITSDTDTYRVLYEAELAEHLVGTDYYYLSTTETNYISGRLFEAKNKAKNFFNINFASTLAKEKLPSGFEREIGLYFNPTKFSILRVDGEYIRKIKPELKDNFVYVFPDPNQYGDIVNLSNTKRDNPFNFYFDKGSYKNISSSSSRACVKADEKNHYFHSYETVENRRINITNDGTFIDSITDLTNYGSIDKIESDIYGNEYIQFITNKGVIKNSSDITVIQDAAFESGNTIDISENRYGDIEQLSGFSDKVNSFKKIYFKDVVTKNLVPLSGSDFKTIYDKFKFNNTLYNQIINSDILDINVYEDTFSFDLSTYSIIDTFKYNGKFIEQVNSPLIIERDVVNPDLSFITKDCYESNSIYKFNISLSGENLPSNNTFYYELYKYDTNKKIIDEISTRNSEPSSYFLNTFNLNNGCYDSESDANVSLTKILNSELNYNSYDNSFILTTTFLRENSSIAIHYYNYKIINNKIEPLSNNVFTNFNDSFILSAREEVTAKAQLPNSFNFLTGGDDLIIPSLSFPVENFNRTVTLAYSGTKNINFDLQNVEQSSNGLSLYRADVVFGDGDSDTFYSTYQPDNTLKLDNFSHRYYPFNNETYSDGSIKFYYENGKIVTVNLEVYKLIDDLNGLKLNTINGQKTNSDNFTFNLIDGNNTIYNYINLPDNRVYTLSSNFNSDIAIPSFSNLSLLLSTQNVPNGTSIPFTVNSFEYVENSTGIFVIENNTATATISSVAASSDIDINVTLDFLGVTKCFTVSAGDVINYNINLNYDVTNVPITSFDPDGNVNDRPRINTFREDGKFIKYLSAGGVYEDDVTHALSIPPWGDKSTASTNTTISAISGTAGIHPWTLSAGVNVFAPSNSYIQLTPDISNWVVTDSVPGEKKYQILFNTKGTKNLDVNIYPEDVEIWSFTNPGTNTIAWILSSEAPLSNTFNWADGSARETFNNNAAANHTFTGTGSFSGVRYSNGNRINKFASRLTGGSFPTNTYAASGTIDLSKLPNLIEYTIEDHKAYFINFNSVNTGLNRFQHWNNKNTGVSFNDLDLSRLPNLQVFSVRGSNSLVKGDFTGQLHSTIPSTLNIYNAKWNSLTGNLPTFTSNFSNMKDYDFTQNSIGGSLKNLANLGSNRSTKDVQFLGNRNSLNAVAGDFTINSNFFKILLLGNSFTTANLNTIVQKCDASGVTNCTLDLRAQPFPNTVTDTASVLSLQGKGWTVQF